MKFLQKKGQAAMEFLMTYGWALLVVLIAIAALAAFGVLNPKGLLPDQCSLVPGLACLSFKADNSANNVEFRVKNSIGSDITAFSLTIVNPAAGGNGNPVGVCDAETATYVGTFYDGLEATLTSTACSLAVPIAGSKLSFEVRIDYTVNSISHSKIGKVVASVEV